MSESLSTPNNAPQPPANKPPSLFERGWELLQDLYDTIWVYCDPVTKVCYTHLSHHYEHKYRQKFPVHHSKVFYFDMFLLALLSALIVLWFFVDALLPLVPVPPLIRIDAVSPTAVMSGQDEDYVITFENQSDETVVCAVVRVQLPPDTYMAQDVAEATADDRVCTIDGPNSPLTWESTEHRVLLYTLNTLGPRSNHSLKFVARTYGASGSGKPVTAELTYWEPGAAIESRVSARSELAVASSALQLDAQMPPRIERGRQQIIAINYKNVGDRPIKGAAVRVSSPEDFVVTGGNPTFAATNEWRLGDLEPAEFGTLTLRGYFKALPARPGVDAASVFALRGYVAEDAKPNVLAETVRVNADTRAADLTFYQEVSPLPSGVLIPGDTVRVTVHYRNEGTASMYDAVITVDAGAAFIAGGTASTQTWDKRNESDLAEIRPGVGGTLTATFTVKPEITAEELGNLPFPSLHISSRGEYALVASGGAEPVAEEDLVRVDTGTADLPIASRLGLEAAALYYTKDGDQLGVGPLPPTVGQTTKYRVFFSITATTGDVREAVVEALLPENVRWTGDSSVTNGSSIDYLPTSRRVRWQAGLIPAGTGPDSARVGASFEVEITPVAADVGSSPVLLQSIDIHGQDAATGLPLRAMAPAVTTDLPFDVRAAGKGAVVN